MSKFFNVPTDKDTNVFYELELKFNSYDVLHQKWDWDGIKGESLIFLIEDVKDLSKEDLIELVNSSPIVENKEQTTYSVDKSNTYVFLNFNFKSE